MKYSLALVLLLPLSACFESESGPSDLRYDRHNCELCRMIISDPRFAVQIRGGPNQQLYLFDDIGDAINWLKLQAWQDEVGTKIWVNDYENPQQWLDARQAVYLSGLQSPMNYGFGAVFPPHAPAIDFDTMRARVLSCCPAANTADATTTPAHQHGDGNKDE